MSPDPETSARIDVEPNAPRHSGSQSGDSVSSPEEAVNAARQRLHELLDAVAYYLSTRVDVVMLAVKRRIVTTSLIAVAVLVAAGAIVTAAVLLCVGISDGLSVLLGHRWAGELLTAGILLGLVCVAGYFGINRVLSISHRRTVRRYEKWRIRQRSFFGRDVTGQGRPPVTPPAPPGSPVRGE